MRSFTLIVACIALAHAVVVPVVPVVNGISPELFAEFKHAAELSLTAFPKCKSPLGNQKLATVKGALTGYVSTDSTRKMINVVMRGSMSARDFVTDAKIKQVPYTIIGSKGCIDCKVQEGIHKTVGGQVDKLILAVKQAKAVHPDYGILITGHSLGGATAQLVGLAMRQEFGPQSLVVYALGSTRVGNANFAKFLESQFTPNSFYRLTHTNDGVPLLPPTSLGYIHAGTEYWMNAKNTVDASQVNKCNGAEDPTCVQQYKLTRMPINSAHVHYIVSFLAPKCLTKGPKVLASGFVPLAEAPPAPPAVAPLA